MDFRRRQTVPTTMAADPRSRGISRRGVLKTGLAASASLMVRPVAGGAQDATPRSPVSPMSSVAGWSAPRAMTSTAGSISRSRVRRSSAASSTATWWPPSTPTLSASTRR